jgi:predicted secreted protein
MSKTVIGMYAEEGDSQYGVVANAPERRRPARAMVILGAVIAKTLSRWMLRFVG